MHRIKHWCVVCASGVVLDVKCEEACARVFIKLVVEVAVVRNHVALFLIHMVEVAHLGQLRLVCIKPYWFDMDCA